MHIHRVGRRPTGFTAMNALLAAGVAASIVASAAVAAPKATDEPPPEFGAIRRPYFGCPKVAGVYAWPPMNLEAPATGPYAQRMFDNHIVDLVLHEPSYLWLHQPDDRQHLLMKTIAVPRERERIAPYMQGWQSKKLANSQNHCSKGWLILDEHDYPVAGRSVSFGGKGAVVMFRVVPLADGNLAIGRRLTVRGVSNALFWADAKIIDLPDGKKQGWTWAKLKRVADDGSAIRVDYR